MQVQEKRDKLIVQLVIKEDAADVAEIIKEAKVRLVDLFGAGMQVEFRTVKSIARDASGKLRKIVSHVSIDDVLIEASGVPIPIACRREQSGPRRFAQAGNE